MIAAEWEQKRAIQATHARTCTVRRKAGGRHAVDCSHLQAGAHCVGGSVRLALWLHLQSVSGAAVRD